MHNLKTEALQLLSFFSGSKYGKNYLLLCYFCALRKNNTTTSFLD